MGQTLLTFAALSWIAFFLKQTQGVFVPFVAAFVLSLASAPVVEGLRRRGVPYWLAVLGIVLFGLLALAGVGILLEETIGAFVEHAPRFKEQAEHLWERLTARLEGTPKKIGDLAETSDLLRAALGAGGATAMSLLGGLFDLSMIALYLILLLSGRRHLAGGLRNALGRARARRILRGLVEVERELFRFALLRTMLGLGTGGLVWLILGAYGVEFAPLWALLTFIGQYVPFVGPLVASVLPILMAAVQFPSFGPAVGVLVWLLFLHWTVGFAIEPRIFSVGLRLNQTLVLLGLGLFGWMWGAVGVLLWVPLLSILKLVAKHYPALRPLEVLLGPASGSRRSSSARRGRA
jgi:predicted PurR-regulated permease PerM